MVRFGCIGGAVACPSRQTLSVTGHLPMCMVTYPDANACLQATSAWNCWWAGFQISQHQLLGLSILAWARIGKAVQFLSAAFILIEIGGPQRFKSASTSIATWPTPFRRGLLSIRRIGKWFWTFLTSILKLGILLSVILMPIGLIAVALSYFGLFDLSSYSVSERVLVATGDLWAGQIVGVVFAVGLGIFGCLVAYSLLIGAVTKLVEIISTFLSWLIGHSRLQSGAKLFSWILFVVGFALDFLGS